MKRVRELTLDEMLADPIVHLLMHRDGVREDEVRSLIARVRQHLLELPACQRGPSAPALSTAA
jgi:hypothetical protein